ncbi:hypothetical protein [Hymenobacter metallilatus]|uniref:MABP domain-containing protein n=1 Tax=Hymenobacter metallilatus TaxID=2493666 RepID=A0A3R9NIQ4_9BACT|nr:hypothetical protein [Hymenobacter metallilatus]RSK36225.1 hypothetical protein EI290_04900 [Hymenobacter metallilatus]
MKPVDGTSSRVQNSKKEIWSDFLNKIENNEQEDPLGQYVSKKNYLNFDGSGLRAVRAKYNYYERSLDKKTDGEYTSNYVAPTEPCETAGCGATYSTPVFVSSENDGLYNDLDNPNGYIYDLKIVSNSGVNPNNPPGYTRLPIDLNDKAGGSYIYLTFVRDPKKVQNAREYYQNSVYASGPVTNIEIKTGGSSPPSPSPYYYHIYEYSSSGYAYFGAQDLNNGAWGSHIWSYQTKQPGNPIEIGILSGDADNIQPPLGWYKYSTDLNQGAGGKFIYLCKKNR